TLAVLYLSANEVEDVSPLISLAGLQRLSLSQNQISDIAPLLANSGLGDGDHLDLKGNNLDLSQGFEDMADIRQLEERGVQVEY
ncbi:MAG: leucine-rich repeat domain-containing protein, partial [Chloroflexi bacterium]|nr:leucine-rich repeat domain-containing protein [Chloroflexota bacterium]